MLGEYDWDNYEYTPPFDREDKHNYDAPVQDPDPCDFDEPAHVPLWFRNMVKMPPRLLWLKHNPAIFAAFYPRNFDSWIARGGRFEVLEPLLKPTFILSQDRAISPDQQVDVFLRPHRGATQSTNNALQTASIIPVTLHKQFTVTEAPTATVLSQSTRARLASAQGLPDMRQAATDFDFAHSQQTPSQGIETLQPLRQFLRPSLNNATTLGPHQHNPVQMANRRGVYAALPVPNQQNTQTNDHGKTVAVYRPVRADLHTGAGLCGSRHTSLPAQKHGWGQPNAHGAYASHIETENEASAMKRPRYDSVPTFVENVPVALPFFNGAQPFQTDMGVPELRQTANYHNVLGLSDGNRWPVKDVFGQIDGPDMD